MAISDSIEAIRIRKRIELLFHVEDGGPRENFRLGWVGDKEKKTLIDFYGNLRHSTSGVTKVFAFMTGASKKRSKTALFTVQRKRYCQ